MSGIARAARAGVLVKGGACLDALADVGDIALDKTGTLTTGRLWVADVRAFACSEPELLALAASVERHSEHPIAAAVVAAAEEGELA